VVYSSLRHPHKTQPVRWLRPEPGPGCVQTFVISPEEGGVAVPTLWLQATKAPARRTTSASTCNDETTWSQKKRKPASRHEERAQRIDAEQSPAEPSRQRLFSVRLVSAITASVKAEARVEIERPRLLTCSSERPSSPTIARLVGTKPKQSDPACTHRGPQTDGEAGKSSVGSRPMIGRQR